MPINRRNNQSFDLQLWAYWGFNTSDSSWWICRPRCGAPIHPRLDSCLEASSSSYQWVSIDLVWGNPHWPNLWKALACMYPGSSPSCRHMVVYLSLLSSALGSLGFWAGRPWWFLLWFLSAVKGLWRLIVVEALVEEPLTLLDNYVLNQTPPLSSVRPLQGRAGASKGEIGFSIVSEAYSYLTLHT